MVQAEKRCRQRGFSLIELMAVIFVIGIAMAAISISVGGNRSQQVRTAARYLHNAMHLALEEAVITQSQIGVHFDVEGSADDLQYSYQFLRYQPEEQQWAELPDDVIEVEDLPSDMELEVRVDGELLIIGGSKRDQLFTVEKKDNDKKANKQTLLPDIYFLSSGEMPDFSITLKDEKSGAEYKIQGNMLGQLSLVEPHEQKD